MTEQQRDSSPHNFSLTGSPVSLIAILAINFLLLHGLIDCNCALAQATGSETHTEQAKIEKGPGTPSRRPTAQQVKAYVALAALAGIVIAGIGMLALTIAWGGRLRRQLRQPMRDCAIPERDFWFLKPQKPTVTESSLPEMQPPSDITE